MIHGNLPCTNPRRFASFDILEAEPVETIRRDVGKFVSGDTGILLGCFAEQADISNALYMLGLREHVERLYTRYFIDSTRAQDVQVARERRRMARNIYDLLRLCLAQKL